MSNVSTCFTSGKQMLIPAHQRLVEVVLHPDDVGICGMQCDVNCSPSPDLLGTKVQTRRKEWRPEIAAEDVMCTRNLELCPTHSIAQRCSICRWTKLTAVAAGSGSGSSDLLEKALFDDGFSFHVSCSFQILFIFWWFILFLWSSSTYEAPCQGFWWRATLHANCCSLCVLTFYFDDDALSQLGVKHMKTIESPRQEGPWICKAPVFPWQELLRQHWPQKDLVKELKDTSMDAFAMEFLPLGLNFSLLLLRLVGIEGKALRQIRYLLS